MSALDVMCKGRRSTKVVLCCLSCEIPYELLWCYNGDHYRYWPYDILYIHDVEPACNDFLGEATQPQWTDMLR